MSALATGVTMPTAMSLASRAEASQPRAGGHLRIAIAPGRDARALVTFATANTLVEWTAAGRLTGDLARSFEAGDGGRTWHFTLRPGVRFQDGTPLSADEAVRALAPLARLPEVDSVTASGALDLTIRLHVPDSRFAERLAEPDFALIRTGADGTSSGTGAYRVTEETAHAIHLTRRDDAYWKAGRAHVDQVTVTLIQAPAARQAAVMSGEVDYAAPIPPEAVAFLNNLPGVDLAVFRGASALMAAASDAEDGPAALAALRDAVPRGDVLGLVLAGQGRIGDDTPWPLPVESGATGHSAAPRPTTPTGPYGLTAGDETMWARQLAGLARARGLELRLSEGDGSGRTAPLYSRVLAASDMARIGWDPALAAAFMPSDSGACRDLTACLTAAHSTLDPAARRLLLDAARDHVARAGRLFLPAWADALAAHRTTLHHGELQEGAPNDGHRMIERWWVG